MGNLTIKCAAIKFGDYILWLDKPARHSDILESECYRRAIPMLFQYKVEYGFLTSDNEFVSRTLAYHIAKCAKQLLPEDRLGHTPTPGTLYTEDLW